MRLLYDACRVALTETNVAFFEGSRVGAQDSPVVDLLKWTLSGDMRACRRVLVCDLVAESDVGWGAGPIVDVSTITALA